MSRPLTPSDGDIERLREVASGFPRDPLLESVIIALWHEARVHGASTPFFEQGVAVVLSRLETLSGIRPARPRVAALARQRFDRVAEFVEARLAENVSVAAMSTVAGYEPSGFARAFKARTGLSPFAWVTHRRMERAKTLLAAGRSVTEVAGAVGYLNASKFAAAFRRLTGASPSLWVREVGDDPIGRRAPRAASD